MQGISLTTLKVAIDESYKHKRNVYIYYNKIC